MNRLIPILLSLALLLFGCAEKTETAPVEDVTEEEEIVADGEDITAEPAVTAEPESGKGSYEFTVGSTNFVCSFDDGYTVTNNSPVSFEAADTAGNRFYVALSIDDEETADDYEESVLLMLDVAAKSMETDYSQSETEINGEAYELIKAEMGGAYYGYLYRQTDDGLLMIQISALDEQTLETLMNCFAGPAR